MTSDPLDRFVRAQDAGTYAQALAELSRGRKRSHWMWFVFPQLAGLGQSSTARQYALSGPDEARDYLAHRVLGPRLVECCEVILEVEDASAEEVFGRTDAMKLCSSMTLFSLADPDEPVFTAVLERYFSGVPDALTVELLG